MAEASSPLPKQDKSKASLERELAKAKEARKLLDQRIQRLEAELGIRPSPPAPTEPAPAIAGAPIPFGRLGPPQPPPEFFHPEDNLPSVDVGRLSSMSADELDRLPFGVITLDDRGRIVNYSDTESRLTGLPKAQVIGKYFFEEVAPCARVRDFEGRFRDFASGRSRFGVESFDFVFRFARGAERVAITITPARTRGRYHVCLVRKVQT